MAQITQIQLHELGPELTRVTAQSVHSGKFHEMDLPVSIGRIRQWQSGGQVIQNALPELTADQREFLMTGITAEEWAELFDDGTEDFE